METDHQDNKDYQSRIRLLCLVHGDRQRRRALIGQVVFKSSYVYSYSCKLYVYSVDVVRYGRFKS